MAKRSRPLALCVLLLCLSVARSQAPDSAKPVDLDPQDIAVLADPKAPGHEAALRKYHGRLVRLPGSVTWGEQDGFRVHVTLPKPSKGLLAVPVRFADPAEAERVKATVLARAAAGQGTPGTLVGRAAFARDVEAVGPDYVVPDELKPRERTAPRFESGTQMYERLQRELIEEEERMRKVLDDARRKGKLLNVRHWGLYSVEAATVERRK